MNKLYTLSYFRKRLKDAGYQSKVLIDKYSDRDSRYWTISIDPKMSLICTCLKTKDEYGFVIYADFNISNYNNRFMTNSMEVIINFLNSVTTEVNGQN